MTYLWRIASDCPDNLIAIHDKDTVDPVLFRKAVPFDSAKPVRFVFRGLLSTIRRECYFPNSAMLPLVSNETGACLLNLAGTSVQGVPAVVACDDGEMEATLINPLKAIPAVDWSASKALHIPGTKQVMKLQKLQLLPESMEGIHLARLDDFRSFLLVSECVKDLFAGSRLCEFTLPSEIRP
ncbi:hypothetical protein [Luteolibacter sp. LG18]|uniref:hypothetical protein n=1 Tax=Luteolibacter sp. LG18 TaxID=2819286 RepID=UPI002B2B2D54|nr:hypothetical protein llg_35760 [Luteolibacter sp. LG18]